ncbi:MULTISPECIES: flavodoxin family protein [unclassified Methanoregula]|uniref:flavodoxin family protein n=1 Tax=unclassified Methanoregula TaxID=2649730 RepID=UPI0009D299BD|nr:MULTISPECIES: flavodoxin family protein [unclassified Methanoregula]OPX64306.1 MAG: Iron-sulfur flavoprotein [Methanoregula sp. PtaB.Bin085]OPY33569.1 MAG: Iron-sulfur flavoprotein [Methanoregula sp. PtaU1.Bin006]
MNVIAINGSPRKTWNTATLLEHALKGAESQGAETELIHLYNLDYKGCSSCFACKLKDGKSYGKCAMKDGLSPVLEKIRASDVLILGSPIDFGIVTGEMRSFMERLFFPDLVYSPPPHSLAPALRTAFVYTMNVTEQMMKERLGWHIKASANALKMMFGHAESFICNETLQFEDYDKVVFSYCDPEERRKRQREVFPQDCRRAYQLGVRLTKTADTA